LFNLDAEVAHDVTMSGLALAQGTPLEWAFCSSRVSDPVELAGLKFPNRVGMAAGLDKNARCIDGLAAMGFGFVEVGTVTPKPQSGNPKPRMFRIPQANALINRLGFNNEGLDAFVANVQRSALRRDKNPALLLGLNIGKNAATPMENAIDDYLLCLDAVYPHADYVTVNISSPNTKNLRSLQSDEALDQLLGAIAHRRESLAALNGQPDGKGGMTPRRIPIFLKIAPDLDTAQISVIAATLKRYGTNADGSVNNGWGVIATNTTIARDAIAGMPHSEEAGGLSGTPVLQQSNVVIAQLRAQLGPDFPIIGVGGILSAEDAVSKIQAGADVVQIYTGLIYRGPDLVRDAALAIKALRQ
jgi:dihydroorotate dehydrogenase